MSNCEGCCHDGCCGYFSELNNPVKPVVSLLCEVYLFFLSPFYILYSITFVIHDFPVQQ